MVAFQELAKQRDNLQVSKALGKPERKGDNETFLWGSCNGGNNGDDHQAGWRSILPLAYPGSPEMQSTQEAQQRDMSLLWDCLWQTEMVLTQPVPGTWEYHLWYSMCRKIKKQVAGARKTAVVLLSPDGAQSLERKYLSW